MIGNIITGMSFAMSSSGKETTVSCMHLRPKFEYLVKTQYHVDPCTPDAFAALIMDIQSCFPFR